MWHVSIVIVAILAALLFILRARYHRISGGHDERRHRGGERSPLGAERSLGSSSVHSSEFHGSPAAMSVQDKRSSVPEGRDSSISDPEPSACSLVSMEPGRKATVLALTGGRELQAKLVSMGFNVGSEVTVLKDRVGGSGLLVATGDTRLAIGNGIAERIVVAAEPTDGLNS